MNETQKKEYVAAAVKAFQEEDAKRVELVAKASYARLRVAKPALPPWGRCPKDIRDALRAESEKALKEKGWIA